MLTVDTKTSEMTLGEDYLYKSPIFPEERGIGNIENLLPNIDQLFEKEIEKNNYPGLAYGLILDGKLIHSRCFGYSNREQKIPTSTKTVFRIASMTKSFTAMAILKLRDEGKLRLDDPVHQYVPEIKTTNMPINDAPVITIRHLLTQHAGLPTDDPWGDRQLAITDDELLSLLKKGTTLAYPSGTTWEYTNLAFAILGRIIAVVSQMSYQEYIRREILDALDMSSTCLEYSEVSPELLAQGYRWECNRYSPEPFLHHGAFGAMGGLLSSIEDFAKYVSYHMQAWPVRDDPELGPIRRSSLREMQHPWNFIELGTYTHRPCSYAEAYCYGLFWSKNSDGIVSINHSGGLPGFGSNWTMLPEYGIGIVVFSNRTYADLSKTNYIALETIVSQTELKPRQLPVSKFLADAKEQIIKIILNDGWNVNDLELSKIFAENFFLDHSLEIRKATIKFILREAGKMLSIEKLIPNNQTRGQFEVQYENQKIRIHFSLSPENPPLIQEIFVSKINQS